VKITNDPVIHKAKLIGFDVETDLAVLKVDAGRPLAAVQIGNSDAVDVGDWAIAIGSPFGLESTVTAGIVSAKGRDIGAQQFQRFIQTDAAINRGNSGGPLLNIRGEVIGVNTMIATQSGGYQGVGFALPSTTAVKVYNSIIRYGRVPRGSIGVSFGRDEQPDLLPAMGLDHGVIVSQVQAGGPADRAGIKAEDIITEMDGKPVRDGDDLVARVADTEIGKQVRITVDRGGKKMEIPVTVGDRSEVWKNDPRFSFYRRQDEPAESGDASSRFGIYVRNLGARELEEMQLEGGKGVVVTRVEPGSLGDEIGLRDNDVIVSINRQPVGSVDDIKKVQHTLKSGDPVAFRVARPVPTGRGREVAWRPFYLAGRMP
jgi:serine protease Do